MAGFVLVYYWWARPPPPPDPLAALFRRHEAFEHRLNTLERQASLSLPRHSPAQPRARTGRAHQRPPAKVREKAPSMDASLDRLHQIDEFNQWTPQQPLHRTQTIEHTLRQLQSELNQVQQKLTAHLRVPVQTLPALPALRQKGEIRAKTTVRTEMIVSAGKNGTWMYNMGRRVILCSTTSKICKKRDQHARDGQSLVHFILHFWDQLPQLRFAIVHGSLNDWHHPHPFPPTLERAFQSDQPFVHLGLRRNYKTIHFDETGWCKNAWRPYIGPCPHKVCVAQGLEFVANGELFTWIPKYKWEFLNKIGYGELAPEEFHLPHDPWLGIDYMFEWVIFMLANQTACPPRSAFQ